MPETRLRYGSHLYDVPRTCPICQSNNIGVNSINHSPKYWMQNEALWTECLNCHVHFGISGVYDPKYPEAK